MRIMLLTLLLSLPAHAISERDYVARYAATVAPFAEARFVRGTLEGARGLRLAYRKSEVANEKGAIVFAVGMGEGAFRYPELAFDLAEAGYSLYVLDPRGQGASAREVSPSRAVYVESYEDYVADLHRLAALARADGHARLLLLANSMGGAVGALALRRHPEDFAAAALAVPMLGINLGGLSEDLAFDLTRAQVEQGRGADYAPGMGEPTFDWRADPHATRGLELRAGVAAEYLAAHRDEACGGPSIRWVYESIRAMRDIRGSPAPASPLLILQAGRDTTVLPDPQRVFCARAPDCRLVRIEEASHQLLADDDAVRAPALAAVLEFFSQR